MLLAQINDEPLPETRVVLPASLTVRESCGGQPLDAFDPVDLFAEEDRRPVTFDPTGVPGPISAYQPTGTPIMTEEKEVRSQTTKFFSSFGYVTSHAM